MPPPDVKAPSPRASAVAASKLAGVADIHGTFDSQYEVGSQLGSGAFSIVYRCMHRGLNAPLPK
jgi:hypothetical protein